MRLAAVCVNRCTSVAQCAHKVDELGLLPLERVVVVIHQNGIGPTLMRQLEGTDDPVVARLAVAAQGCLVGSRSMASHRLVHHVDNLEVRIVLLHGIIPLHNRLVLLSRGEAVHPTRILRAPDERVELEGEVVLLGIVGGIVCPTPVELPPCTSLNGRPLRLILRRHLVPQLVEFLAAIVHLVARGDVTEELVRILRQTLCRVGSLRTSRQRQKAAQHSN